MPRGTTALQNRATELRLSHPRAAALGVPGERRGATAKLRERGASKDALAGKMAATWSTAMKTKRHGKGGVAIDFGGVPSRGMFFVCPVLGFHLHARRFSGDGTIISPGIRYPYFGSERSTRTPDQWFDSHPCSFISLLLIL